MFEGLKRKLQNTISELEKIQQDTQKISIEILPDSDGFIDKECPNKECLFQFKVNAEDWKNLFKDEQVFCPLCRHDAPAKSWFNSEQLKEAKAQVLPQLRERVLNAWSGKSIKAFSFSSIQAREEMILKITCQKCNSRFAVIGSAYFCPCCGYNSVERTFDESLEKVEIKLNNIPSIKASIAITSKDAAEVLCRSIIESTLSDCVVAFQRICEATYLEVRPNEKLAMNVFQRLEDGSNLWKGIFNQGLHDWLTESEFDRMNIMFNRRHLLAHKEGLVDLKYLQHTNDLSYKDGQRIVVKENDVIELLQIIRKVVGEIRRMKSLINNPPLNNA